MNYLTEIKLFHFWLETHELTPAAILLWYGLMYLANKSGWDEELALSMRRIEGVTLIMILTLILRTRAYMILW